MLGLGWGEMLVIASIAVVVLGPKDLVVTLRGLGRSLKSVRGIANDFQRQVNDVFIDADINPNSWVEPEEPAALKEAQAKAMRESVNKSVLDKETAQKAETEKAETVAKPKAKTTKAKTAKKPAAKKPAAKKPATKKPTAKKPTAKKPTVKKATDKSGAQK